MFFVRGKYRGTSHHFEHAGLIFLLTLYRWASRLSDALFLSLRVFFLSVRALFSVIAALFSVIASVAKQSHDYSCTKGIASSCLLAMTKRIILQKTNLIIYQNYLALSLRALFSVIARIFFVIAALFSVIEGFFLSLRA